MKSIEEHSLQTGMPALGTIDVSGLRYKYASPTEATSLPASRRDEDSL
jgi:hypothetical protein